MALLPGLPSQVRCLHVVLVLSECGLFIKELGRKQSSRFEKARSSSDGAQKVALPVRQAESAHLLLYLLIGT